MQNIQEITQSELEERIIRSQDWVPSKSAFIDCKTPGSDQKDNYSYVGTGVSQSSEQFVNVTIPHGFQLGAAGMPNGLSNSLHLHFTAEVFINFEGEFNLRWGPDGEQGNYLSRDGDVISVPTWIFRGFTNVGPDDGLLYTTLGRDDTGGIIWGRQVLNDAEGYGLYLNRKSELVDTTLGQEAPAVEDRITPLTEDLMQGLDKFTENDFRSRVVRVEDRKYSDRPFLCSSLPGGRARLATVIGYGLTEDGRQAPNIHNPHNFCAAWLSAAAGEGVLAHSIGVPQTVTVKSGVWKVVLNNGENELEVTLHHRDALSIPANVVRRIECVEAPEGSDADLYVVTSGDGRVEIDWHPDVVSAAEEAGFALDPGHYVCSVDYLHAAGLR